MTEFKVLGSCYPPCPQRLRAIVDNEFGPAKSLGGWVLRDGPFRRLSLTDDAKWRALYYGCEHEDHTKEPYIWVTCPFCGKDLAPPPDDEGIEDDDGN